MSGYSDAYNTEVYINGKNVYSGSYYPGLSCNCRCGMYGMNSCFNFGFNNIGTGLGIGFGLSIMQLLNSLAYNPRLY